MGHLVHGGVKGLQKKPNGNTSRWTTKANPFLERLVIYKNKVINVFPFKVEARGLRCLQKKGVGRRGNFSFKRGI